MITDYTATSLPIVRFLTGVHTDYIAMDYIAYRQYWRVHIPANSAIVTSVGIWHSKPCFNLYCKFLGRTNTCHILVRLVLKFLQTFKGSFRAQSMPITRSKQLVGAQEFPRGVIQKSKPAMNYQQFYSNFKRST